MKFGPKIMDRRIWTLLAIVFIDLVGFGIVIPIFPLLVEQTVGKKPEDAAVIVGLLIAVYSLFQFLGSPILGRLSDKFGRRPVLFISMLFTALSYLIIYVDQSLAAIVVARIIGGVATSNISVVQAYVADISQSHERTKQLALLGAAFGLGFIVGPFLGGVTASLYALNTPFLMTGLLSLIGSAAVYLFLPESNKALQKDVKIEFINLRVMREVVRPRNMFFLIFLFFLANFSLSLVIGVFPLFSQERFGWDEQMNGYYFMAIGVAQLFTQTVGIRYLLTRFTEPKIVRIGMVIFGLATIGIGFGINPIFVLLAGGLSAVGFGLLTANIQALISLESKSNEQGIVMGVAQSFASFARVLGPIIGGLIASWHLNYPYYFSGIMIFLALFWGYKQLTHLKLTDHGNG